MVVRMGSKATTGPNFCTLSYALTGAAKAARATIAPAAAIFRELQESGNIVGSPFSFSNPCLSLNRSLAPRSKSRCGISHISATASAIYFRFFSLAETAPHPKYLFALYGGECDEANGKEEASMPNPKECRRYALECVWLAQVPEFPQARKAYLSAAKTWLKLANELDFASAVEKSQRLTEQDDFEYKNAS